MIKLNLGCEDDIKPGFVNVDIIKRPGVMQADLNKKRIPFKSNYADYILISHLIEYLDSPADFMHEVWRIAKKGAVIDLVVDHYSFGFSYAEMRHKRPGFSYFTFGDKYFNKELYKKFKVIRSRFNFTRHTWKILNYLFNPIINFAPIFYERFFSYIIPCSEIHFRLKVIK